MKNETLHTPIRRDRMTVMTFDMALDIMAGKLKPEDIFRLASDNAVPCLDVMDLSEKGVDVYRRLMERYPVRVKCYIGSGSMLQSSEKIEAAVTWHLSAARSLGADILMLVPVSAVTDGRKAKKLGHDQVLHKMIEGYRIAVRMAAGTGIRIGLETTPQDFACCSGIADCKAILEAVPGLGLIYDTANMLPHGDDPVAYYEALKEYIIHVHLKDVVIGGRKWSDAFWGGEFLPDGRHMTGVLPGTGIIPIRDICDRLEEDGYTHTYAIEYRRPAGFLSDFGAHSQQLKKVLDYLNAE